MPSKLTPKRLVLALAILGGAVLLLWVLRPRPVPVETARVARGPLRVTVDEEGETRVRHRYVVSAPVGGRLERIGLEEGDRVRAGQVVARLDLAPLDARGREQAAAHLAAAEAARREAEAGVARERAAAAEAARQLARAERLAAERLIPAEELDAARTAARVAESAVEAARQRARAAGYEVESARAALLESAPGGAAGGRAVELRSPIDGAVLRVCEECEKVVVAGADLVELGDPAALEVVVDVLSTDAVAIRPGAPMLLAAGFDDPEAATLRARVRLIEPSGFTKVSPLGVEEQRVNVVGDFLDPPTGLADRYRVEAKIVLWEAPDVLRVPAGALFRHGDGWAVFVVDNDRARLRPLRIGHRNPEMAEVLAGAAAGETVIVHPSDAVEDGARVIRLAGAERP